MGDVVGRKGAKRTDGVEVWAGGVPRPATFREESGDVREGGVPSLGLDDVWCCAGSAQ